MCLKVTYIKDKNEASILEILKDIVKTFEITFHALKYDAFVEQSLVSLLASWLPKFPIGHFS